MRAQLNTLQWSERKKSLCVESKVRFKLGVRKTAHFDQATSTQELAHFLVKVIYTCGSKFTLISLVFGSLMTRGLSRFPCEMEPTSWVQSTYTFSSYLKKTYFLSRGLNLTVRQGVTHRVQNFDCF